MSLLIIIKKKTTQMKIKIVFILLLCSVGNFFSQDLVWNGNAANNDFFTEANWEYQSSGLAPDAGVINWNTAINLNLSIQNVTTAILANGIINLGAGSLSISNATINGNALSNGTVTLLDLAYIDLSNSNPFQNGVTIHLNSGLSWVRTKAVQPAQIQANFLSNIKVNTAAAVYQTNLRLDNYYFDGSVIRSNVSSISPVTLYDRVNLGGTSVSLAVDAIHSGNGITNMNNKISSFRLRKGFMLTIADHETGTGRSKNYIASEEDLIVNELPTNLKDNISFARVIPWNWVSKKGIGGDVIGLDNTWFYRWANDGLSTVNVENAPMAWGVSAADDDADITIYKQKYKATHVMGFNEPDDCNAQSGQFRNLCQEDVAIGYYRNLMKTGMRIVSPGGREEAPSGWLQDFYDKATAQDIRIDVIAVHWYDWGSNPAVNTNPTAQQVFDRFKSYLTSVYTRFGKPIWITEFNANPNRNNAINLAFMQLALPYLETLDYVERYAWFEPSSDVADYYDVNSNLTNVGTFYKNHVSTPSIPESTVIAENNTDTKYRENLNFTHNLLTNGDFKTGDIRAWVGTNSSSLTDNINSNIANRNTTPDITKNTLVGNINSGAGSLSQILEVGPEIRYTVSFDYKWYSIVNTNSATVNVYSGTSGASTSLGSATLNATPNIWYTANFTFTVPLNVFKARLLINKTAGDALRIDNVKITVISNKTWNGATDSNWNSTSNWAGGSLPTNTDVVFIPRGLTNYPTVSDNITLKRLFIDSGASFITSGSVGGIETYFVHLPDDKWHLISTPFQQTINAAWVSAAGIATGNVNNTNIAIGTYQNNTPNGVTGPWVYFKSTDAASAFTNGKGFSMKKLSKGMFIFNGNLVSGDKSINITTGTGTGSSSWNLIGNPYPSYINVDTFLTTNTTSLKDAYEAVFVWNAETENYDAMTDGFIHPGQAFFVNSNVASTNVSITASMLSHQRNINFYKSENKQFPKILLNFSDGTISKQTEINYLDGKTTGLDPRFDIGLFDGVAANLSIFTHLVTNNEGISLMRQTLPNSDFENMVIPIGINAMAGKEITFSADATNLPDGLHLYIEDKINNSFTKLDDKDAIYKTATTDAINGVGRFYIHTTNSVLGAEDVVGLQHIGMYTTSNSNLRIVGLSAGQVALKIYSLLGKEVLNHTFQAEGVADITLPKVSKGIYIIQLTTDNGSLNKKIILK
jgi:hypothetical protein